MISIIFPVHCPDNEAEEIQRQCFESFIRFTQGPVQTIVVDNGSVKGVDAMKLLADIYVRTPEPIGFARAVNIGWKIAEGDVIGVVNNDIVFTENWLPPLLEAVEQPGYAAVAPSEGQFEKNVDHVWSSCFFMKKKMREKIGFFDEEFLPYRYHDQDYWIRAKKLKLRFLRVAKSVVKHYESTTFSKLPKKEEYIKAEEAIMRQRWGVTMAEHYA